MLCRICDTVFSRLDYEDHVCRVECEGCGQNLVYNECECEEDEDE